MLTSGSCRQVPACVRERMFAIQDVSVRFVIGQEVLEMGRRVLGGGNSKIYIYPTHTFLMGEGGVASWIQESLSNAVAACLNPPHAGFRPDAAQFPLT